MSIDAISRVWEHSAQKGSGLLMMLALADYANDFNIAYPSELTLAAKTRLSERQTQRLTDALLLSGEIYQVPGTGNGYGNPIKYFIAVGLPKEKINNTLEKFFKLSPTAIETWHAEHENRKNTLKEKRAEQIARYGSCRIRQKGDILSEKGDILSAEATGNLSSRMQKGDILSEKGDIFDTDKTGDSVNVVEPHMTEKFCDPSYEPKKESYKLPDLRSKENREKDSSAESGAPASDKKGKSNHPNVSLLLLPAIASPSSLAEPVIPSAAGDPAAADALEALANAAPSAAKPFRFMGARLYPVNDLTKVIVTKPFKSDEVTDALVAQVGKSGYVFLTGKVINADKKYLAYTQQKPKAPRHLVFDAFAIGMWGMKAGFDAAALNDGGKKGGAVGAMVRAYAALKNVTYEALQNDKEAAKDVADFCKDYNTSNPDYPLRKPSSFTGEYNSWVARGRKPKYRNPKSNEANKDPYAHINFGGR